MNNDSQTEILVTSAAGRTGAATVHELLARGFPVRAFAPDNPEWMASAEQQRLALLDSSATPPARPSLVAAASL